MKTRQSYVGLAAGKQRRVLVDVVRVLYICFNFIFLIFSSVFVVHALRSAPPSLVIGAFRQGRQVQELRLLAAAGATRAPLDGDAPLERPSVQRGLSPDGYGLFQKSLAAQHRPLHVSGGVCVRVCVYVSPPPGSNRTVGSSELNVFNRDVVGRGEVRVCSCSFALVFVFGMLIIRVSCVASPRTCACFARARA